jgi:hypothetical protein
MNRAFPKQRGKRLIPEPYRGRRDKKSCGVMAVMPRPWNDNEATH